MFTRMIKNIACGLFFISPTVMSGVEIGGTRIIYTADSNQAAISVKNPDTKPYLIQSWVSRDENSDESDSTFDTTPPLFRLNATTQNSVRIVLTGARPPADRESIYWLNIKAIPSSSPDAKNELLIAVKSKMKLMYRPTGLSGDPLVAWKKLQFSTSDGKLTILNPTPYSISLHDVKLNGRTIAKPPMILPFDSKTLPDAVTPGSEISWHAINDYGGVTAEMKNKI